MHKITDRLSERHCEKDDPHGGEGEAYFGHLHADDLYCHHVNNDTHIDEGIGNIEILVVLVSQSFCWSKVVRLKEKSGLKMVL